MGFCDMCGAHLGIYDTRVSLERTDMAKYGNYELMFVCIDCLHKIEKYDKGEDTLENFHFAKYNVEKLFIDKKEAKITNLSKIEENLIISIRDNIEKYDTVKVRQFDKYGNILSIYVIGK